MTSRRFFNVLSLDGGGARGLFLAESLAELEKSTGRRIVDDFDLIAGTSAGAIIALGLGSGLSADEIARRFRDLIGVVFPRPFVWSQVRALLGARYQAGRLEHAFGELLGDKVMSDSVVPLVIPAWVAAERRPLVFKTAHSASVLRDGGLLMREVARATSAAPTYFRTALVDRQLMLDGGIWANNPALVGVLEAHRAFGVGFDEVRLLSIGCIEEPRVYGLREKGLVGWARAAVPLMMRGSGAAVHAYISQLLPGSNYRRVEVTAATGKYRLDFVSQEALIAHAVSKMRSFSARYAAFVDGEPVAP